MGPVALKPALIYQTLPPTGVNEKHTTKKSVIMYNNNKDDDESDVAALSSGDFGMKKRS